MTHHEWDHPELNSDGELERAGGDSGTPWLSYGLSWGSAQYPLSWWGQWLLCHHSRGPSEWQEQIIKPSDVGTCLFIIGG